MLVVGSPIVDAECIGCGAEQRKGGREEGATLKMEHSGSFISGFGFGRTASSPVRPRCSCVRADGDDVFREGVQEGSDKLQRAPSERVSGVTTACQRRRRWRVQRCASLHFQDSAERLLGNFTNWFPDVQEIPQASVAKPRPCGVEQRCV